MQPGMTLEKNCSPIYTCNQVYIIEVRVFDRQEQQSCFLFKQDMEAHRQKVGLQLPQPEMEMLPLFDYSLRT